MNRFAVLTAAALTATAALTGVASAQAYNTGDYARATLVKLVPSADVSGLTNAEAVAVLQAANAETGRTNAKETASSMIRDFTN
ncbi:hypothetical protein AL036_13070 [Salipiger aestuarii]|uniref:DUF4148 domain-containing protein n=1 Tax=Salipiger aestuarii TaxID=568098 RepID=A0A327XMN4_9RHOB|nr:hypothetical protein [Salipiger aestuarii]EIE52133.1 hypothetical protein C357_05164 [Citreicella sp. 357]KAA8606868.1 hypothetical protein AL036_13070 [Salipiger aestuarii]KAA8609021.1 hypothetical protein AL037_15980 [Salipiger aestuarii]KAB2537892.1 hypothetical protein AL035_19400 [Salipiger aestuarii]RAK09451.1 hypothetical protein ATI53_10682 [Salipiger aestuarii]